MNIEPMTLNQPHKPEPRYCEIKAEGCRREATSEAVAEPAGKCFKVQYCLNPLCKRGALDVLTQRISAVYAGCYMG